MANDDVSDALKWEKRFKRERKSREEAEAILKDKSRELYRNYAELEALREDLEAKVALRTHELEKAKEEAVSANEAKTQFVATMSHELRTPLNGLLGMSEILSKTVLSNDQRSKLKIIEDSGKALLAIISDILDFSRLEVGRMTFERRPFCLRDNLRGALNIVQQNAEDRNLQLCEDFPEITEDAWYLGDSMRLRQVLLNLLSNAIKFTNEGSVTLHARRVQSIGAMDTYYISIEDTGVGIDETAQRAIFRSFTQANEAVSREYGGSGLGLSICRQIVESQGGEIIVESEVGRGSKFWFELSFEKVEASVAMPSVEESFEHVKVQEPVSVLIVEDNEINRIVTETMLHEMGHEVACALDGEDALKKTASAKFDIIFMDMRMPKMNGVDAAKQIRGDHSNVNQHSPIIALTANATLSDISICQEAGMDDFVSKPVQSRNLESCISRALATRSN